MSGCLGKILVASLFIGLLSYLIIHFFALRFVPDNLYSVSERVASILIQDNISTYHVNDFEVYGKGKETTQFKNEILTKFKGNLLEYRNNIKLVNRRQLDLLIDEYQQKEKGRLIGESSVELGKLLGIQAVITGSIYFKEYLLYEDKYLMILKIINIENGTVETIVTDPMPIIR